MAKNQINQKKAAAEFAEKWKNRGDEKQDTQAFWTTLLRDVYGLATPEDTIEFEKRIKLGHTSFIDAYIPETKVLIEQKSADVNLTKAAKQSDGAMLTPFRQAKRYADEMPNSLRPNWIVVSNFQEFLIYDMENPQGEPTQIMLADLPNKLEQLQFMVNPEKNKIDIEAEVSLKAGELVGKLYDALIKEYINPDENSFRSLNILCVRIVFCLYAEDAGLFETRTAFEDYIKSFQLDNLRDGIKKLFKILDTKPENRDKYDTKINSFPYVNGGLFADDTIEIPNFTKEIVDVLVNHCAPFDWSKISPTIFGAVFESTLNPETRRKGGMHYTSIENIHKVIDPLFLDGLRAEFHQIVETFPETSHKTAHKTKTTISSKETCQVMSPRKRRELEQFRDKIASLTFLDPACGSGNFLTETYISLRRLENEILRLIHGKQQLLGSDFSPIKVKISQFYGIEINDFAVTVAKTALWIAESQMMKETEEIVEENLDFLPLSTSATIVEGNALRMDWSTLKSDDENNRFYKIFAGFSPETDGIEHHYDYIMGNPPFVGARWMEAGSQQKLDMEYVFNGLSGSGNLDYVSAWYKRASELIKGTDTKCAFVSTNSITQGEQAAILWKMLFNEGFHIDFAWTTFKWDSESTEKAHVHCVIVGFSDGAECKTKRIYNADKTFKEVENINGYLLEAPNIFVESVKKPLCNVPEVGIGNKPIDGGNYIFTQEEKDEFLKKEPQAKKYFHRYIGSEEFINNKIRYILYLGDCQPSELFKLPECLKRVETVRKYRLASKSAPTIKLAEKPTKFHVENFPNGKFIVIPQVSSERRAYIPIGYLDESVICSDKVRILPNGTLYHFGILTSNVHNAWMRAICCRLKSDYSYTVNNVYNTFPWCNPTEKQKAKIEATAQSILDARAKYADFSLAQLYGDKAYLFPELLQAHRENDRAVMQLYGFDPKMSEAEIVAELFKMYEKLTKKK